MNRRELINALSTETGADTKTADAFLKGFTDVVTNTVSRGETVAITGFAKFAKVERGPRMGRNPATGEAIQIKASKKVRITPLKAFKDAVMGGGAKKATAKKAAPKKTAPKKAAPKKAAAKKSAPKKTTAKKAVKRR
ncbi:MAG: histone family protein DNA-binding protein [Acidimicrobiales bacterium]|nr:histone family protein DNA-binding protein [Acidimicrobiales bacterium]